MAVEIVRMLESARGAFHGLVADCARGASLDAALADAYRLDPPKLEARLHSELARHRVASWLGLGVVVFWVVVFVAHRVRRRRQRSSGVAARPHGNDAVSVVILEPAREPRAKRSRSSRFEPFESEVPRISHDGRWHTLH